MKKLMIIAAVALASTLTQAASFQWVTSTKTWGVPASALAAGLEAGTTYNVGSANADTMSNELTSYNATWAYVLTLSDGLTTSELSGSLTSTSFKSRVLTLTLSDDLVVAGADLNYSIVFTGTVKDANDKTWEVTANTISGSWHVNDQGDIKLSTASPASWSTASVPEPTSGILMLVGLGALALRRRRA